MAFFWRWQLYYDEMSFPSTQRKGLPILFTVHILLETYTHDRYDSRRQFVVQSAVGVRKLSCVGRAVRRLTHVHILIGDGCCRTTRPSVCLQVSSIMLVPQDSTLYVNVQSYVAT